MRVKLTPADHAWQNESPGASDRVFQPEDACGFWIETPDGTIWAPGDSRLIPDHHLQMPAPDALLFDFSDSEWHFGLGRGREDGERLSEDAAPAPPLGMRRRPRLRRRSTVIPRRCLRWSRIPSAFVVLAPGEPYELRRLT